MLSGQNFCLFKFMKLNTQSAISARISNPIGIIGQPPSNTNIVSILLLSAAKRDGVDRRAARADIVVTLDMIIISFVAVAVL